ncbi:MAG: MOSC N-terminal beta barrel domain-containing protein [Betaproteobacteria bacterium]
MTPTIGGLFVYPVKSCRGFAAPAWQVGPRGLLRDREWMIVGDAGDPLRFLTQRECPRLALIETALLATALTLSAPGMGAIDIEYERHGNSRDVVVWRDQVCATDQGDAVAEWLSAFTGRGLRLVHFDPAVTRLCNREYAGDSGAHTGFADGYPLLVIGSASLDDLNARLRSSGATPLPMNRFRPNLVVNGLEAYDEDHLSTLDCGEVTFTLVKPCVRCQITTTDQATAEVGSEPLRTLAGYRNNARLGGVTFGINAIVTRGIGRTLAAGSSIEPTWAF